MIAKFYCAIKVGPCSQSETLIDFIENLIVSDLSLNYGVNDTCINAVSMR